MQHSLILARAWAADYAYVGYWEVHGFLFPKDLSGYLTPSAAPLGTAQRSPVLLIAGVYESPAALQPAQQGISEGAGIRGTANR